MSPVGMSWHCENEKRMDRIGSGIIQCKVDGQICLCQQYCPSKRIYEITASVGKCEKRKAVNADERENERESGKA